MKVLLNGESAEFVDGSTVKTALEALDLLGLDEAARGVAVAVDAEVVPRAEWGTFLLGEDAQVEVLTAVQGG